MSHPQGVGLEPSSKNVNRPQGAGLETLLALSTVNNFKQLFFFLTIAN
jgi:hypothetical protein